MRSRLFTALAATACLALSGVARGDDKKVSLSVGDKAPTFEAVNEQGKTLKSSDHVGKKLVVVYFFPAAFTGG